MTASLNGGQIPMMLETLARWSAPSGPTFVGLVPVHVGAKAPDLQETVLAGRSFSADIWVNWGQIPIKFHLSSKQPN